jgi:hypothetical protein
MIKNIYILSGYLLLSFMFYIYVAEPALNGSIELRVWADAPSYEDAAANYDDLSELVTIVNNYIGPVLIIKLLNNDYFYIYLLNCIKGCQYRQLKTISLSNYKSYVVYKPDVG